MICFSASPETSRNSNAVAAAELAKNLEDRPAGAEETESGATNRQNQATDAVQKQLVNLQGTAGIAAVHAAHFQHLAEHFASLKQANMAAVREANSHAPAEERPAGQDAPERTIAEREEGQITYEQNVSSAIHDHLFQGAQGPLSADGAARNAIRGESPLPAAASVSQRTESTLANLARPPAVASNPAPVERAPTTPPSILTQQPTLPLTSFDLKPQTQAPEQAPTQGPAVPPVAPAEGATPTNGVEALSGLLGNFDFTKEGSENNMRQALLEAAEDPQNNEKMMKVILMTVIATIVNVMSAFGRSQQQRENQETPAPLGDSKEEGTAEDKKKATETLQRENEQTKKKDAESRVATELDKRRSDTPKEPMSRVRETGEHLAQMKKEKTDTLNLNDQKINANLKVIDSEQTLLDADSRELANLESKGAKNDEQIIAALKNRIEASKNKIAADRIMNTVLEKQSEMLKEDLKVIEDKETELKSGVGQLRAFFENLEKSLKLQGIEDNISFTDIALRLDAKEGFVLVINGPDEELRQVVQDRLGKERPVNIVGGNITLTFDQLQKFGIKAEKPTV
mgnify:CR=1 FL=1